MEKAKNIQLAGFYRQMKTINGRANAIGSYEVYFGDYHKLFDAATAYQNVTKEDVQRVAEKYFGENNRTVGTLIPDKTPPARAKAEVNSHELPRKNFRHECEKDAEENANHANDNSRAGFRATSGDARAAGGRANNSVRWLDETSAISQNEIAKWSDRFADGKTQCAAGEFPHDRENGLDCRSKSARKELLPLPLRCCATERNRVRANSMLPIWISSAESSTRMLELISRRSPPNS